MMEEYQIPDEERRQTLETLRDDLHSTQSHLPADEDAGHGGIGGEVADARTQIEKAIDVIEDKLYEMPEWDSELVRSLVLPNIGSNDVRHFRQDGESVMTFSVGGYGDETACRYAVAVTTGNEWFHIRGDDGWYEVWSNTR